MDISAEGNRNGIATRLITLVGAWLQQLKAAALERGKRGSSRHMVLVESLSLGNRRQLFLVACDDQHFLVGAGTDAVSTVVAMPGTVPDAALLHAAALQGQAVRIPAVHQRPDWMRDRSVGASGLQLVKREEAHHSTEAGRSQWS